MRVLILGGTTEASGLAAALAIAPGVEPVLSLAGRTAAPVPPAIPHRIGGFGGVAGLEGYLAAHRIDRLVDATHPFAARMSRHAAEAASRLGLPHAILTRPEWRPQPDDRWTAVLTVRDAVQALGETPRRVFLTVGRLSLPAFAAAPQHTYLIRTIDRPDGLAALPRHELIQARGPFDLAAETALMREHAVAVLVTKNSGGAATYPKLAAARALGLPVVLVERPPLPGGGVTLFHDLDAVLDWLGLHAGAAPVERAAP